MDYGRCSVCNCEMNSVNVKSSAAKRAMRSQKYGVVRCGRCYLRWKKKRRTQKRIRGLK